MTLTAKKPDEICHAVHCIRYIQLNKFLPAKRTLFSVPQQETYPNR